MVFSGFKFVNGLLNNNIFVFVVNKLVREIVCFWFFDNLCGFCLWNVCIFIFFNEFEIIFFMLFCFIYLFFK